MKQTRTVTFTKDSQKVSVLVSTGAITVNGAESTWVGNVDNGKLYLPLEAFNQLIGKSYTWDSFNERIVKN